MSIMLILTILQLIMFVIVIVAVMSEIAATKEYTKILTANNQISEKLWKELKKFNDREI